MQSSSEAASSTTAETPRARKGASWLRWSSLPTVVRRSILLVAIVLLWQIYVSVSGVSPLLFSSPVAIAEAFLEGWISGELAGATLVTLQILGLGMLLGMLVAAVLTTFATWTQIGDDVLVLLTSMLNPLPAIAILPLAILWFGLSPAALVFVIANAVTWPIAINVSTGCRTIIAAELVFGVAGGGGGLGYFINDARYFLRIPEVFAGLVTIALIGIALDAVFTWIERKTVIKWGMKSGT